MTEPQPAHSDQILVFRELRALLERGFTGNITLRCLQGVVRNYIIEKHIVPGKTGEHERDT